MDDALSITRYAITPETSAEDVAAALSKLDACMERAAELKRLWEADLTAWIEANGPLDAGQMVYWLGHEKQTKCTDVPGAVDVLLTQAGGDLSAFARDYLAAQPIKHGAAKRVLDPETFGRLFQTSQKTKLESGESLPKKLMSAPKEFVGK